MATLNTAINASQARKGQRDWEAAGRGVRADARKTDAAIKKVDKRFGALPPTLRRVRFALTSVFIGLAAGRFVRQFIDVIAEVEESLIRLQGVSRATAEEFEKLSDAALKLGVTTRFSADEVAKGQLNLARAGFTANEVLAATADALDLAVVGNIELSSATNLVSNSIRQFGLDAEAATRVVDALTIVSNNSKTTIEQLGQALKFAGPVAATIGEEIETTAAALGVLADRGLEATKGGTRLRTSLLKLTRPTAEAQRTIKSLGLTLAEVDPSRVGIIAAFEKLGEAQLTAREAATLFGVRIADAGLILSQNAEAITKLQLKTVEFRGETKRLADEIEKSLTSSFKFLKSALEANIIALGRGGLGGAIQTFVDSITDGLRVLAGFNDEFRTTEENAQRAAKIIAGGLGFIGAAVAIKLATAALAGLKVALLTNPITFIPTILAAGVGALIAFRNETITLGGVTATLGDFMRATFDSIAKRVKIVTDALGPEFRDVFLDVFSQLGEELKALFKVFQAVFSVDLGNIIGDTIELFATLVDLVVALGKTIAAVFRRLGDGVEELLGLTKLKPIEFVVNNKMVRAQVRETKGIFDGFGDELNDIVSENLANGFAGGVAKTRKQLGELPDILEEIGLEAAAANTVREITEEVKRLAAAAKEFFGGGQQAEEGSGPPKFDFEAPGGPDRISSLDEEIRLRTLQIELIKEGVPLAEQEAKLRLAIADATAESNLVLVDALIHLDALNKQLLETQETERQLAEAQEFLSREFTGAFSDAIRGVKSLKDAMGDLFLSITQQLLELALLEGFKALFAPDTQKGGGGGTAGGFTQLISSFFAGGSHGAVMSGASVVPFQKGGVISAPSLFPLAGNKTGIAGEAGLEGLFPITRDSRGNMAVSGVGGEGGRNISVVQNISTPDADSFRRSRKQIEQDTIAVTRRLN